MGELADDELIGQAMKPVTLDTFVKQLARDGKAANEIGLRTVKRRIE